ncbi:hypothetical protein JL721_6352 [Aureococcus anophagefferens]|nr:hypothetical protein JL721_6352 [Aureococcus anophagefferens]
MGLHRALAALLVLALGAAASEDFSQVAKLVASDGAAGDEFGWSVASSGDFVVVGAYLDDDAGTSSGSAYVFRTVDGVTEQIAKLVSSDAAAQDQFGASVAIHNDIIVVGANHDDDAGYDSGSAYIFKTSDGGATWPQVAKLVASDGAAGDEFGWSIASSGDFVVVGANLDDDAGTSSGSAYAFRTVDGVTEQIAKLVSSDAAAQDQFGVSVAIHNDIIVVGAAWNDDAGSNSGSAYIFKTSDGGATWPQVAKLVADDAEAYDLFGWSVAVEGNLVVVGALQDDTNAGSAYAFRTTDGGATWTQAAKLAPGSAAYHFGTSLSISGNTLAVGAYEANSFAGGAYLFSTTDNGASWTQDAYLQASDYAFADRFYEALVLSGNRLVVGATYDNDMGGNSGSVYIFEAPQPAPSPTDSAPTPRPVATPISASSDGVVTHLASLSCLGNDACPSAFTLDESGIASEVTPSSTFGSDGTVTLVMDVVTTGSSSELTGTLSVGVDCIDFQLAAGFCQEADSASLCAEHSTVSRTLDPTTLVEACPGSAVQDENGIITLTLGVTIGVGHSDPFDALASFEHEVTYTIDVVDRVVMSSSTAGIDTQTVSESLDLGVAAHRVALASSSTAPCDIYSASASSTMDANSRVCLMLNTTDEDSESYVAFLKTATVRNLDSGLEYALVSNRKFGQSAPGYKYAGAWLNDAHADLAELTKAYHDYFTFFLPPGLRPDEGATANLEVQMVVEYHHVDTGARKLRRATRELQAAANEDAAVLQLGASNPSLAEEGTAGVDLKLELDGLPLDDYLASGDVDESLVASTVDAARVITGDQVELTGVAASADGIFVQIHVSGIDDAGARSVSAAVAADVTSGNFYFRLASNGLVVNTVVLAGDVVAYEEAAPISVVDLEVESAIAFENLDVSAFNDDARAPLQFKKAIVASVADVTSTDQVKNVRAVEASRRRKLEAGALVEYTVVVTQTLRDAGADYAATYLSEFVAGVAAAADDGLFVQVLQQGGQVFADVAVDVEATSAVLEDDDDGTESASADVPMFIGIAGVVVLAVGLGALYKARKTNAAVPPVVEAETAKAPEV